MRSIFRYIQKNIFLILATLLFGGSLFFAYSIFDTMGYFNPTDQTLVGTIYISNYEESQYQSVITSKINEWQSKSTYDINYQGYSLVVDLDYFTLDLNSTIDNIDPGQINDVYFVLDNTNRALFETAIENVFSSDIVDEVDVDALIDTIITHIGKMHILKHYYLEDFFSSDLSDNIIDAVQISNIANDDVDYISNNLPILQIDSKDRYSLLNALEDLEFTNNQLSIIASGILKSTYKTPFSGYTFEQNQTNLSWSEEGANVRILKANHFDLTFYNTSDFNYYIEVNKLNDSSLSFTLIGLPFVATYSVNKIDNTVLDFQTQYIDDETIDENTPGVIIIDTDTETTYRLLIQTGITGKISSYVRTITTPDGNETTKTIFVEIYNPVTEIYNENIVLKAGD